MESVQQKFYQKELEVNALLEITQAVNNNLPEEDLYKIYEFTLRGNLLLDKMALYVKEAEWECKVQFGTERDFSQLPIDPGCLNIQKITDLKKIDLTVTCFSEFDIIIPVLHKSRLLAFVFIKSLREEGTAVETTFIQALSNIILVAIENKRLARKQLEQQAFLRDMEIAKNVQNNLFPKSLPRTERLEVKAFYEPCQTVGGDYYDYIALPDENQFIVCIADVSGKGIPAALLMSNFQAVLRTLSRKGQDLEDVVHELNYQLSSNANGENFITFFVAVYDYEVKNLRYVNAGHNPPILIDHAQQTHRLTEGTTVLGAFEPLPFLKSGVIEDLEQFSLFLFTDGLTETFDKNENEFGPERLETFLLENLDQPLDNMHQSLLAELQAFSQSKTFSDDLTFLSCRVNNVSA